VSLYTLGTIGGEAQIVDRVSKWQSFPDDQLRAIMAEGPGTERFEAAKRILDSRGSPTLPIVVPTGSVTLRLPGSAAPQLNILPTSFDLKNPIVLAGIAAAAVVLGLMFTGKR